VFFDQGFEEAQRAADHFGIGGRFRALFQALEALHGLRRHFQPHSCGGAFAVFGVSDEIGAAMAMLPGSAR